MTTAPVSAGVIRCPECGASVPATDPWCDLCDWNVDPDRQTDLKGRGARAQRRADRRGERLHNEVLAATKGGARLRQGFARVASYALASCVLLALPASTALIVVCWVTLGFGPVSVLATIMLVLVVIETRPRLGSVPTSVVVLDPAKTPELHNLVARLAGSLGVRRVPTIGVEASCSAWTTSIGLRRRGLVTIGMPLWDMLSPQERAAVLSHELAHALHGDLTHSLVISNSSRTLTAWYQLVNGKTLTRSGHEGLADLLMGAWAIAILGVLRAQISLALRGKPLAEYNADLAAAKVASGEATASALDKTLLAPQANIWIGFHRSRGRRDILEAVHESLSNITPRRHERFRRAARLRNHSVDETHPPTMLRIDLLSALGASKPLVLVDDVLAERIDAELTPYRTRLNQKLIEGCVAKTRRRRRWFRRAPRQLGP